MQVADEDTPTKLERTTAKLNLVALRSAEKQETVQEKQLIEPNLQEARSDQKTDKERQKRARWELERF